MQHGRTVVVANVLKAGRDERVSSIENGLLRYLAPERVPGVPACPRTYSAAAR